MSSLKTGLDSIYAYRFIDLMQKPFTDWKAYQTGVINDRGIVIKKPKTEEEKSSYTPFHAAVRAVKKVASTVPVVNGATSLYSAYSALSSRFGLTESDTEIIQKELKINFYEDMVAGDSGGSAEAMASGQTSGDVVNKGASVLGKKKRKRIATDNKV